MYRYKGQKLNRPIAEELILELFAGSENVKKAEIKSMVLQEHSKGRGLPHTTQTTPITGALKNLRDTRKLATNPKRGYWTFKEYKVSETEAPYITGTPNNNTRNKIASYSIEILKSCVLEVLYKARDEEPLSLEIIHGKLNIQYVKDRPASRLIEGVLAHLFNDGHIYYILDQAWKINEAGIKKIEGSVDLGNFHK